MTDISSEPSEAAPEPAPAQERPTVVVLVRHGHTPTTGKVLPGRASGLHLSERGLTQADALPARFKDLTVDALYTSPMERARETARPLEQALNLTAEVEHDLIECDFGEWTGEKLTDLSARPEWQAVQRTPSTFRFPDGESFAEMQYRVVDAVDRLRARHRGQTIVCFSHADPLKVLLAHALGSHLDHFQRLSVDPCSVSAISWSPDGAPSVLGVNSTSGPLAELLGD